MFSSSSAGFSSLAVLAGLFGLATTILWLVIGWRAMRAHESLAESAEMIHRHLRKTAGAQAGGDTERAGHRPLPKLEE